MPTIQDQLEGTRVGVTFEDINTEEASRILHNGTDFIKCEFYDRVINPSQDPRIIYYKSNGDRAASYSTEKDFILDMSYLKDTDKYYTIRHDVAKYDTVVEYFITDFDDDFSTGKSDDSNKFNEYRWDNDYLGIISRSVSGENAIVNRPFGSISYSGILKYLYRFEEDSDYTTSIEYDLPLLGTAGALNSNATLKIKEDSGSKGNLRYSVGAEAINTSGSVIKYRVASSGVENTSSPTVVYFQNIDCNPYQLIPFVSGVTNDLIIKAECLTEGDDWGITYTGTSTVTGAMTPNGNILEYEDDRVSLEITTDGDISNSVSGENVLFHLLIDWYSETTSTGILDISRNVVTPGISCTYSTSLSGGGFDINYGLFDFFSYDDQNIEISTESKQFELTGLKLDNFTVTSGAILEGLPSGTAQVPYNVLNLEEVDDEGQVLNTIVNRLDILPNNEEYEEVASGIVLFSVSDSGYAFVKVKEDVYKVNLSGSLYTTSGYYDETSSGVSVSSGIISESGITALAFNETTGGFLQYLEYDSNTSEVRTRTLDITSSGVPITSDREVFLEIPDWEEHSVSGSTYQLLLHGTDHNTLFYFRKHGTGELNTNKATGSDGVKSGNLFSSSSSDFVATEVKEGDIIKLSGGPISGIKFGKVTSVVSTTSLLIDISASDGSGIDFEIASNADLIQFNTDPTLSAFVSTNIDDFSIRAGTSDTSNVSASVINAWGDPLQGKTVNFVVSNGPGVVSPGSDTTNASGIAESVYTAGGTPGSVEITTTVTD